MANIDSNVVTKEWNGFGFKVIDKSDYASVFSHLQQNFLKDEPIHQMLCVTADRLKDFTEKVTDILDLGHGSFYAFPLEEPTKIAAVLIIWIHEKGNDLPVRECRSPLTLLVKNAVIQLKQKYSIHDKRQVDNYPEIFIISTDKEFRKKGLAAEMYKKSILKLKADGHRLVSSTFTNPISRKVGEQYGFKEVSRLYYNDCKHEDGSSVFGEAGNERFVVETVLDL